MRRTVVAVLAAGLAVSMTPVVHQATPVAASVPAAAPQAISTAVPAKKTKKKRKRVVLRVRASGYPGSKRPRIVVAKEGFRKYVPRSGKMRNLPRGKYRVWATPVVDGSGTSAVPDLPRKVKVRPKKKRAVLRLQYVWSPRNDTYPPSPARSLELVDSTPTSITLQWVNGRAPDLQRVAVRRNLGHRPPASLDDGRVVGADRLMTQVWDTGLRPHTSYSYSVFMIDAAGNPSAPASLTVRTPGEAAGLAAGGAHTCALLESGSALAGAGIAAIGPRDLVECWGANDFGQLGVGDDPADTDVPQPVDLADVVKVVAGSDHTCALRSGGEVHCWGRNDHGQAAPGDDDEQITVPRRVSLPDAADVSAGVGHACAALRDGSVRCWGANDAGQLGAAEPGDVQTVVGIETAVSVGAGYAHTCAVLADASLRCWGDNDAGQLGDGTRRDRAEPVDVGLADVRVVSAGVLHTCAVLEDDSLRCWGDNGFGQVGVGRAADRTVPSPVDLPPVDDVELGSYHSCATPTSGGLRCWGRNSAGRLGDGTTVDRSSPVSVYVPRVTDLAAGGYHTCAATSSGSYCWGSNSRGQLGIRGFEDAYRPGEVLGL